MNINKEDILERLNPADSFTLAMDEEIRRDDLAGSYGCFALELSNIPDIAELELRISEFSQRFPVSQASLQQIGRRFYWCKRTNPPALFFQHHCPEGHNEADFQQSTIDRLINHKQARETTAPIEFHLLTGPTRHTFFTRWLHPFCDARGADLILKYLCTADEAQRRQFGLPETGPLVNAQLGKYRWWQKIGLLLKGKRYITKLDSLESIQPFNSDQPPQRLNYTIKRLSEAQTGQVIKLSRQYVGLTGTSLYYIGCLMRALEKMHPDNTGVAYCAPYAFNLRKQRALTPITGNHLCALFAQARRGRCSRPAKIIYPPETAKCPSDSSATGLCLSAADVGRHLAVTGRIRQDPAPVLWLGQRTQLLLVFRYRPAGSSGRQFSRRRNKRCFSRLSGYDTAGVGFSELYLSKSAHLELQLYRAAQQSQANRAIASVSAGGIVGGRGMNVPI